MKTLNFSGSFVTCDLKVGSYRQHVELMKCQVSIKGQGLFFTLAKGHLQIKCKTGQVCPHSGAIYNIQTISSLKPLGQSKPNFVWSILRK